MLIPRQGLRRRSVLLLLFFSLALCLYREDSVLWELAGLRKSRMRDTWS